MNIHWIMPGKRPSTPEPRALHRSRRAVGWKTALALAAAAVLLLPVFLLPLTTAVPILVWLPLLLVALIVVLWLVIRRRQRFVQPAGLGLLAIITAAAVIASQVLASTAPIAGPGDRPLPDSIARVKK
jgi:hypothetical protein